MFPLARWLARSSVVSIWIAVLMLSAVSSMLAGTGPRNVLIVINKQSSASRDIGTYYMNARHVPTTNVCQITCSTNEIVSRAECEANILTPIRNFLSNPDIHDRIDFIVVTKGVPLGANYGYSTGPLSITSILTCLDDTTRSSYLYNPYGPVLGPPTPTAFSHKLDFGGRNLYLVTRLDAYTVQDVHALIDRSLMVSPKGPILLDATTAANLWNTRLVDANTALTALGIPTIWDNTSAFLGNRSDLMGYFSWGSNDGAYTYAAYTSNTFVPGSIADTFVSSSGRTFNPTTGGQSLIADLIAKGACGLNGFVSEPYAAYVNYPQVLFDRYVRGFNLAESFYAATPMLFWKSVVIGDPLMAPYATIPTVSIQFPALPLTGVATISATAADPDGIAEVHFYFDGELVGKSYSEPYTATVDTTVYAVGKHKIEVRAIDASPVSTEGSAVTMAEVDNPISVIRHISEAFDNRDTQTVITWPKVVTAGTAAMGGDEFYIGESDGSCGIKVLSPVLVEEGDVVVLKGCLNTWAGERVLQADEVEVQAGKGALPKPVQMANRALGGANVTSYTKGVTKGRGARNIGLLVTVYGKTTYSGTTDEPYFYIDDGSRWKDGSGRIGVKVSSQGLAKPPAGSYVSVTGISSCEETEVGISPILKARKPSDIRVWQ